MFHLKAAVGRVAEGATAFGNRQASHAITLDAVWRPGEDFGERRRLDEEFLLRPRPVPARRLCQLPRRRRRPGRIREAYGDSIYSRLVDVKTRYDPDNVFHHNQNIRAG